MTSFERNAPETSLPGVLPLKWALESKLGVKFYVGRGLGLRYQVAEKVAKNGWVVLRGEETLEVNGIPDEATAKAIAQNDFVQQVHAFLTPSASTAKSASNDGKAQESALIECFRVFQSLERGAIPPVSYRSIISKIRSAVPEAKLRAAGR